MAVTMEWHFIPSIQGHADVSQLTMGHLQTIQFHKLIK